MSEKPKRKFIHYFYTNKAWRELPQEEKDKVITEMEKKKPEIQKKLGVIEYFTGAAYGVSENYVIVLEADSIETKNAYVEEVGIYKWSENPRTIIAI